MAASKQELLEQITFYENKLTELKEQLKIYTKTDKLQLISGFSIDDFKKSLYYRTYKSYPTLANYQYDSRDSYWIYNYNTWYSKSGIGEYNAVGIRCFMPAIFINEK